MLLEMGEERDLAGGDVGGDFDPRRLAHRAQQQRQDHGDGPHHYERRVPQRGLADRRQAHSVDAAERGEHHAADEIGKPDAAEAADAEDADRRAAPRLGEIIRDQRERRRHERRLADAETHAREHQFGEAGGESRRDGAEAPQHGAEHQHVAPAVAVGVPGEGNRHQPVENRERIAVQDANLGIVDGEIAAHRRDQQRQDVAVDEIHEIAEQQEEQRVIGGSRGRIAYGVPFGDGLRHLFPP